MAKQDPLDPVDWDQVADLITEAYRTVAPKKLLAEDGHETGG